MRRNAQKIPKESVFWLERFFRSPTKKAIEKREDRRFTQKKRQSLPREMTKKHHKTLRVMLTIFGLGSLPAFAIGLQNIDNYHDWGDLAILALVTGIGISVAVYFLAVTFWPELRNFRYKNNSGLFGVLLIPLCLYSFMVLKVFNETRMVARSCKTYVIRDKSVSSGGLKRRSEYYIFVDFNENDSERLTLGKEFYKTHKAGDSVDLCVIEGKLGLRYFKRL